MRKFIFIPALLGLLLTGACGHKEYDTENLDPEMTLFENGMMVPIGSVGPFRMELAMKPLGAWMSKTLGLPEDVLSINGETGLLQFTFTSSPIEENMYKLAMKTGDNAEPYTWVPGGLYSSSAFGMVLSLFKIGLANQTVRISALSPFRNTTSIHGDLVLKVPYGSGEHTETISLQDVELPKYAGEKELAFFTLPADCKDNPTVTSSDLTITLPAHFGDQVYEGGIFKVNSRNSANLMVNPGFEISLPLSLDVNLPLGQFNLKEAKVEVELESTIPIQIGLSELQAKDEEGVQDENIEIISDVLIKGGKPETPASSTIILNIKTLDGTAIPDIKKMGVKIQAKAVEGCENVLLAGDQGVKVKKSHIIISGGITLFSHEQK